METILKLISYLGLCAAVLWTGCKPSGESVDAPIEPIVPTNAILTTEASIQNALNYHFAIGMECGWMLRNLGANEEHMHDMVDLAQRGDYGLLTNIIRTMKFGAAP